MPPEQPVMRKPFRVAQRILLTMIFVAMLDADKKVYTLEGHETELDKYAAQKVTVKRTCKGETLTVESLIPAK